VVQVARAIDGILELGPRARELQGDSPQRVRCVVRIRHVDIGGCLRRGFRASRLHDDGDGAARSDDSFARRRLHFGVTQTRMTRLTRRRHVMRTSDDVEIFVEKLCVLLSVCYARCQT
jgi:hypothetical protein